MYLALRHMYDNRGAGTSAPSLDFMSLSLLFLGIASFLFHASLRLTFEFADEFSMLVVIWSMLQATLTVRQSRLRCQYITFGLAACFTCFAVFYVQSPKIVYHVVAFVTGLVCVIAQTQYLFHWLQPPLPKAKIRDWRHRTWQAVAVCLAGYLIWNIDLERCAELRQARRRIGLPWAWLLELHGWWHILTGIAASQFMRVTREIRHEVRCEKQE